VLAAALIALLFIINEQPPRLVVQTPGIFAFAPSDWWVRVKIQPHADDRWLEIEVDGDAFYRRSDIQLEGESCWLERTDGGYRCGGLPMREIRVEHRSDS
jgi:hypothetical protein